MSTYDSLSIDFVFAPTIIGQFNSIYPITNNDPNFSGIRLKGSAYQILPADDNIIYASSGNGNEGKILSISPSFGTGTIIGSSLFSEITDVAIHPKTNIIYGITPSGFKTNFVRINSTEGDAHTLFESNLTETRSIAFDTSGTLYALQKNGKIYTIDLATAKYEFSA